MSIRNDLLELILSAIQASSGGAATSNLTFNKDGDINGAFLDVGNMVSSTVGHPILDNGTLTKIGILTGAGLSTKQFEVFVNGVLKATVNLIANKITAVISVPVLSGDNVQVFSPVEGSPVTDTVCNVLFTAGP